MDQQSEQPTPASKEKELPPPHDMLLNPTEKSGGQPQTPTFWEKYGSKKWLLPLIVFVVVLALAAGAYYVAGAGSNGRNSKKAQKQLKKNQRNARKQKKKGKKNGKKKKNKNGKSVSIAQPGWTKFSYGSGSDTITMQYPGDMKVNVTSGLSMLDNKTKVTLILFNGSTGTMRMSIEPNPNALSVSAWHDQLAKANTLFSGATKPVTVANQESLLQQTNGAAPAWNAFVPMTNNILFVTMTYTGDNKPAKNNFLNVLDTIQFGQQNAVSVPTAPVTQPAY